MFRIGVEVIMDGLARDVSLVGQSFGFHGKIVEFEERVDNLRVESRVETFFAPNPADCLPAIDDGEVNVRFQFQICFGGDQSENSCSLSV